MNSYLVAASALATIVGLVHSVLGEVLIFSRLRRGHVIPTHGGTALLPRHVRIIWACWHALTVFGWGLAAVLLHLANEPTTNELRAPLLYVVAASMLSGAVLVCYATAARHPGWAGMLGVAVLCWLGVAA